VTVQTSFTSWQTDPKQPDPRTCAPICLSWMRYLLDRWGGANLGCYANRPIVGGSSLSTHASGAATDWRYANPGPGRGVLLAEVLPLFIDSSKELGVQAIHDYVGCRIWRPPGQSGRPTAPSPECGWKQQSPGSQMGQPWATWIHLECLPARWDDSRSVEQMLGPAPIPPRPRLEPWAGAHVQGDPMFIATQGTPLRTYMGNGLVFRLLDDDADVIRNINRFRKSGVPLRDWVSGGVVDSVDDVTKVRSIDELGILIRR
jgi:hypothetical protein